MIRSLLAATSMTLALLEVFACGGKLQGGVDATFDLDAHWGECCYELTGPAPSCRGPDGGFVAVADHPQTCSPTQYCGVNRNGCINGSNGCHELSSPPFACCGDRNIVGTPDARLDGINVNCLPYGLDDGSGLPPLDGAP